MKEQIHAGDGGGHEVDLLPVKPERPPFTAHPLHLGERGDQHPARAAGGVVDRLASLGGEHLHHEVDERAVGVELLRRMARVVGELLDEELIGVAQLVLGHCLPVEHTAREMLDQVLEHLVGQTVAVGPGGVAEDTVELARIGGLDIA